MFKSFLSVIMWIGCCISICYTMHRESQMSSNLIRNKRSPNQPYKMNHAKDAENWRNHNVGKFASKPKVTQVQLDPLNCIYGERINIDWKKCSWMQLFLVYLSVFGRIQPIQQSHPRNARPHATVSSQTSCNPLSKECVQFRNTCEAQSADCQETEWNSQHNSITSSTKAVNWNRNHDA